TPVMRGEGRVVGSRAPSAHDEAALMLRFTRLDLKSKEVLDRAVALREERRSLIPAKPTTEKPQPEAAPEPQPAARSAAPPASPARSVAPPRSVVPSARSVAPTPPVVAPP